MKRYPSDRQIYVWPTVSLCMGPSSSLETRHYGAAALHVGIYGPFRIILNNKSLITRCAFIPVNTVHRLDIKGGIHGKLFVERDSSDYYKFLRHIPHRNGGVSCFENLKLVDAFKWIYEEDPSKDLAEECLNQVFGFQDDLEQKIDHRVQNIIDLTLTEPDRNFSQDDLASRMDLSTSRALHLIKEQLNMPYRRFRIWKRIQNATRIYYRTGSVSTAAVDAGFTDVSHFSKCYRKTYGVNPALVFRKVNRFEIS